MVDDLLTVNMRLRQENAVLRQAVSEGPLAEFVRHVAPFIRAAIAAGLWAKPTSEGGIPGADSVERETRSTLAWLDRLAPKDGGS